MEAQTARRGPPIPKAPEPEDEGCPLCDETEPHEHGIEPFKDLEIKAMHMMFQVLEPLKPEARKRAVDYITARLLTSNSR